MILLSILITLVFILTVIVLFQKDKDHYEGW